MEVRDMLAEDGMLYEDVCLGTRATTERSDTWVETNNTRLMRFYRENSRFVTPISVKLIQFLKQSRSFCDKK